MPRSEVKVFSLTPQPGSTSVESLTGNVPRDEVESEESDIVPVGGNGELDGRSCGRLDQSTPDGSILLLAGLLFFVGLKRPFAQARSKFDSRNH